MNTKPCRAIPPAPDHQTRRRCRACKAVMARQWRRTPKGKQYGRRYQIHVMWSEMEEAKKEVYKAVRRGDLPRAKYLRCRDCGEPAQCYDHRDYLKPHEVTSVCRRCNAKRGPGKNSGLEYRPL